jgi:hypothetical protein
VVEVVEPAYRQPEQGATALPAETRARLLPDWLWAAAALAG